MTLDLSGRWSFVVSDMAKIREAGDLIFAIQPLVCTHDSHCTN